LITEEPPAATPSPGTYGLLARITTAVVPPMPPTSPVLPAIISDKTHEVLPHVHSRQFEVLAYLLMVVPGVTLIIATWALR
jgi:hypothetical protein